MHEGADQHLVTALNRVWDSNAPAYSQELAKSAVKACEYQLECLSASAPAKVVAGQEALAGQQTGHASASENAGEREETFAERHYGSHSVYLFSQRWGIYRRAAG